MAEKTVILGVLDSAASVAKELVARWATPDDHAVAAVRRNRTAQDNFLVGRAGLRSLLSGYAGERGWSLQADHRGKLFAFHPSVRHTPAVCLSHSATTVAYALADVMALGVDIELRRARTFSALADYAFGPAERKAVAEGGAAAFYRIWTLREALGKATGEGIRSAVNSRDQVDGGPHTGLWYRRDSAQNWLLAHFDIEPNFSLSIAAALPANSRAEDWSVTWTDAAAAVYT